MFEQLAELETELEKLESRLSEIYASGDQAAAREAGRRHRELRPVVDAYREYRRTEDDLADVRELLGAELDGEMREYLRSEVDEKARRLAEIEARLRELLVPSDPNDGRNVILEVRGAEGGEEANLWARDLLTMYEAFAKRHGWKTEVLSSQASEMGGLREGTLVVKGDDAWSRLKYEAGPHRVQRVPVTDKDKALRILRSRLLQLERERQEAELSSARRDQVKSGGRSEKIRTYNFKENRVTDHRVGVTLHALDQVLAGGEPLDEIVDALAAARRAEQLGDS